MPLRAKLTREEAIAALRASERRYRSLVEATATLVWVTRPDGALITDMPRWREVTGQTAKELLGDGWLQGIHPDDRDRVRDAWATAVAERSQYEIEYRLRAASGEDRWMHARGVPVLGEDGEVTEIVGTCVDVTDRKALESALEQEQEVLRRVVEEVPAGIALVWGPELRFRLVNEPYRQMVPPGRELLGQPFRDALAEAADTAVPQLERARTSSAPLRLAEVAIPFRDDGAFDGHRYYSVTLQPVPDAMGRPGGVLIVGIETTADVRRRTELQAELGLERDTAELLQRALIPALLPAVPRLEIAVRYRPSGDNLLAGGDWYDVLELGGERVAAVVGDVAGRGVAAATVMGQLRAAVRAHALEPDVRPAAVLDRVARFAEAYEPGEMATLIYAEVDAVRRTMTLARAGHLPALVQRPGEDADIVWAGAASPPLGAPGEGYADVALGALPAGTAIVLFTDGLVERRDEPIDAGIDRLCAILREGAALPLEALCERLLAPAAGGDDVALLVLRLE